MKEFLEIIKTHFPNYKTWKYLKFSVHGEVKWNFSPKLDTGLWFGFKHTKLVVCKISYVYKLFINNI